jgi:hypothetical protein
MKDGKGERAWKDQFGRRRSFDVRIAGQPGHSLESSCKKTSQRNGLEAPVSDHPYDKPPTAEQDIERGLSEIA